MDEKNLGKRQNRRRIPSVVAMNKNLLAPKHKSPECYSKKNKDVEQTKQQEHTSKSGVKTQVFVLTPDILKEMGININALQNDASSQENLTHSVITGPTDDTNKTEEINHSANIKKTLNKKLRAKGNKGDQLLSQSGIPSNDQSNELLVTPIVQKINKNKGVKVISDYFIGTQQNYDQKIGFSQNPDVQNSSPSKTHVELAPFSEFRVPKSPVTPKAKASSNMETASFVKSYLTLSPGEEVTNYISGYKNISINEHSLNSIEHVESQYEKMVSPVQSYVTKIPELNVVPIVGINEIKTSHKESHQIEICPEESTSTSCISLIVENDSLDDISIQSSTQPEHTSDEQELFILEKDTLHDIMPDNDSKYENIIMDSSEVFDSKEIEVSKNHDAANIFCSDVVENYSVIQSSHCKESTVCSQNISDKVETIRLEDFNVTESDTLITFDNSNNQSNVVLDSQNIQDIESPLVSYSGDSNLVLDPQNIVELQQNDQGLNASFYLTDTMISDKKFSNSVSVIQCADDGTFQNTETPAGIKCFENMNTNDFGSNIKIIAVEKGLFTTNVNFSARDLEVLRKTLDLTAGVDYNLCPLEKEVSPEKVNIEDSSASDILVDTYDKHGIGALNINENLDNLVESESSVMTVDSSVTSGPIIHSNKLNETEDVVSDEYYNKRNTSRNDGTSNFMRENLVLTESSNSESGSKVVMSNNPVSNELPPFESVVSKASCMAVKSTIKDYFYSQINETSYNINEKSKNGSVDGNRSSTVCKSENSAFRSPKFQSIKKPEASKQVRDEERYPPKEVIEIDDIGILNQTIAKNVLQNDEISDGDCNSDMEIDYEGDTSVEDLETAKENCQVDKTDDVKAENISTESKFSKCNDNKPKLLNSITVLADDTLDLEMPTALTSKSAQIEPSSIKNIHIKNNDTDPIKLISKDNLNTKQVFNNLIDKKINLNHMLEATENQDVSVVKLCKEGNICLLNTISENINKASIEHNVGYKETKACNITKVCKSHNQVNELNSKAAVKNDLNKTGRAILEKSKITNKKKYAIVNKPVLSDNKNQAKGTKPTTGSVAYNKKVNIGNKQNKGDSNMHGVEKPGGKLTKETVWKSFPTMKVYEVKKKSELVPSIEKESYNYNIFADNFDPGIIEQETVTIVPMLEEDFIETKHNNLVAYEEFAEINAATLNSFHENIDLPFGYIMNQRNENKFGYLNQIISSMPSVQKNTEISTKTLRTYSRPSLIINEEKQKDVSKKINKNDPDSNTSTVEKLQQSPNSVSSLNVTASHEEISFSHNSFKYTSEKSNRSISFTEVECNEKTLPENHNKIELKDNSSPIEYLPDSGISVNMENLPPENVTSLVNSPKDGLLHRQKFTPKDAILTDLPTEKILLITDTSRPTEDGHSIPEGSVAFTEVKSLPPSDSAEDMSIEEETISPESYLQLDSANYDSLCHDISPNITNLNNDPNQEMYEVFIPIIDDDDDENEYAAEDYQENVECIENCDHNSQAIVERQVECDTSNGLVDGYVDDVNLEDEELSNIESTENLNSEEDFCVVPESMEQNVSIDDTIASHSNIDVSSPENNCKVFPSTLHTEILETDTHESSKDSLKTIIEPLLDDEAAKLSKEEEKMIEKEIDSLPEDNINRSVQLNELLHQNIDEKGDKLVDKVCFENISETSETCVDEEILRQNASKTIESENYSSILNQADHGKGDDDMDYFSKIKRTKKPKKAFHEDFEKSEEISSVVESVDKNFTEDNKEINNSDSESIGESNLNNSIKEELKVVSTIDDIDSVDLALNVEDLSSNIKECIVPDSNKIVTTDTNYLNNDDSEGQKSLEKADQLGNKRQAYTRKGKKSVEIESKGLIDDTKFSSVTVKRTSSEKKSERVSGIDKEKRSFKSKKSTNSDVSLSELSESKTIDTSIQSETMTLSPKKRRKRSSKKDMESIAELICRDDETVSGEIKQTEKNICNDVDSSVPKIEPLENLKVKRKYTKRKATLNTLDDTSNDLESTNQQVIETVNETTCPEVIGTTSSHEETSVTVASKRKCHVKRNLEELTGEIFSNGDKSVKCGVCDMEMKLAKWKKHNLEIHKYLGWLKGDTPIDMNDEALAMCLLSRALEQSKRKLVCHTCKTKRSSAAGYLSHIGMCQKTPEEIEALKKPCPICERYMLPQSLKVHIPTHSKVAPVVQEVEVKQEEEIIMTDGTRRKRRAAEKASLTIKKLKMNIEESRDLNEFYTRPWFRVSISTAQNVWRQKLAQGKPMICTRAQCEFTDPSEEVMCEHFLNGCKFATTKEFSCKSCSFKSEDEAIIREHVIEKHRDWEGSNDNAPETEDLSDSDHDAENDEEEEDDDDDEDDLLDDVDCKPKAKSSKRSMLSKVNESFTEKKRIYSYTCGDFDPKETYRAWTKEFESKHYSSGFLFDDMLCNTYVALDVKEAAPFLPQEQKSCKTFYQIYRDKNKNQNPSEIQWRTYDLFESDLFNDAVTIWCGGPVFAMGWVPGEKYSRYLAVSVNPTMDFKLYENKSYSYKNIIQFWDVGVLRNDKPKCVEPANLSFGIAHEFGNIWDMDWCPSSCSEDSKEFSEDGHCRLSRMGLLAVACSDGNAYIYSVCDPNSLPKRSESNIYHTEPVVQLELFDDESDTLKCNRCQATKLMWSLEKGHNIIVVGYSTGMVALFDITSKSPMLKATRGKLAVFSPYYYFQPYTSAINGLVIIPRVIPGSGEPVIVASSMSGCGAWSGTSVVVTRKGRYTNAGLSPHWPNFFACSDPLSIRNAVPGSVTAISMRTLHYEDIPYKAGCPVSGSTSISASWWNGSFVTAGTAGDVFLQPCQSHIVSQHRTRTFRKKKKIALLTYPLMVNLSGKPVVARKKINSAKSDKQIVMPKNKNGFIAEPANYKDTINQYGLLFTDVPWDSGKSIHPTGPLEKDITVDRFSLQSVLCVKTHPSHSAHWFHAHGSRSGFVRIMCAKHLANMKSSANSRTINVGAYF